MEQHHLEVALAGGVMTDVFLTQSGATERHGPALASSFTGHLRDTIKPKAQSQY